MIPEMTRKLGDLEVIQPRDWCEWRSHAFTRVVAGSVFVGATVESACSGGALSFRRDLEESYPHHLHKEGAQYEKGT